MTPTTGRTLLLSGIDPGGGAGLIRDTRVVHAVGGTPCGVPTCLTVQDRTGMGYIQPVTGDYIEAATDAVLRGGPVAAVKVGLIPDRGTAEAVGAVLQRLRGSGAKVVVDPVLSATAGGYGAGGDLVAALRTLVVPHADLCTPNLPECAALAGDGAPEDLLRAGCRALLVTGGHGDGDLVEDVLWQRDGGGSITSQVRRVARLAVGPVHGTGCSLSSAIAAGLALGQSLATAWDRAAALVATGLQQLAEDGPGDGLPRDLPAPTR